MPFIFIIEERDIYIVFINEKYEHRLGEEEKTMAIYDILYEVKDKREEDKRNQ